MKRLASLGVTVLLGAWSNLARAQDPPLTSVEEAAEHAALDGLAPSEGVATEERTGAGTEEPVEVRVIGARADSLQRVPGSGTVMGSKDLERAQPVDTAEMLRRVPGVQVRQDFGAGNRLDVSIRGLEGGRSRRVLMLEDGIPISLNPYSEPDMYFAPPIERYRGIEVVKGSGNILFGPQTLAGTINFLTLAPPERPTAVVDVDAGTYGYVRALGSYGAAVEEVRYVVQVLHRRGDGFRSLPFDSTNVLGKVAIPTGRDGEAMLKMGMHRDDAASDDVGLTSAMYTAAPRRPSLSPVSRLRLERYDVSVTHAQRFSADTKLKTLAYAYRTDRAWRRQDYTRVPTSGVRYSRIVGDPDGPDSSIFFRDSNAILDRQYDVIGFEPRAEHRTSTGDVGHTFDVGGRALRETAHYQQRSGDYAESFTGSLDFDEKRAGTAFSAYVQDRIAFRDDLLVTPGVRVEHLVASRVVLRGRDDGGEVRDLYREGTSTTTGIIPGIGMVYGTKRANVFGGLHVGFAPPRVSSSISPRGEVGNVAADESMNYELGTRTMPFKWGRIEAIGFVSNFSNQVIISTQPGALAVLTDAGATNILGGEGATLLSIDKALDLPTVVELGARYTYVRSTFRYGPAAGNFLPYAPEHSFNTNLDVEHRSGVGGQIAYAFVSRQFADAANTFAEDATGRVGALEPRHIVDATVHYRHRASGITLRLTGKNVFDATYVIARRPEGIFTGNYRQVLLGLRWEWDGAKRGGGGA
jgi:Fe(3+) dicitrate transport protein